MSFAVVNTSVQEENALRMVKRGRGVENLSTLLKAVCCQMRKQNRRFITKPSLKSRRSKVHQLADSDDVTYSSEEKYCLYRITLSVTYHLEHFSRKIPLLTELTWNYLLSLRLVLKYWAEQRCSCEKQNIRRRTVLNLLLLRKITPQRLGLYLRKRQD